MWESKELSDDMVVQLRHLYKNVSCIVIDELSMVSPECLGQVDRRCRLIFDSKEPFGGKSVLLFGDFCQLPPVCATAILVSKDFDCVALWSQFEKVELVQNQRQKNDLEYLELLNSVRFGRISPDEKKTMDSRRNAHVDNPGDFVDAMHIFTRNKDVDEFNKTKLRDVRGKMYSCRAKEKCLNKVNAIGLLPPKREDCGGLDKVISLKVGCKVMLVRNQAVEDGLFNGAIGCVHSISEENGDVIRIEVVFDGKKAGMKNGYMLPW